MEHRKLEARAEETNTIKRRSRRDQVRLMLFFREAQDDDDPDALELFCAKTDYTMTTAKNYLTAYERFWDLGTLPERVPDADEVDVPEVVYEMWNDVYDASIHDTRYSKVDREGITDAAAEMGLKGFGKALDIAKNPKSMTAAILGDHRVADAALQALLDLAKRDPIIRGALREKTRQLPDFPWHQHEEPSEEEAVRNDVMSLDRRSIRLAERDVPANMRGFVSEQVEVVIDRLQNVKTIMQAADDLDAWTNQSM